MAQSEVTDFITPDGAGNIGNESDDSSDSLFKTQHVPSPTQKQRKPIAKCVISPASVETDSSSDSSIEPKPLTLKAIFERFKKKKRKKRKYKPKLRPRGRPPGIKNARNPRRSQIDVKQIKDKGAVFPFLDSENGRKPLPWKKILTYEQAVARGFFHHIEKLKYEHHLKECLEQMHAGEDLEKEDIDSRRHKYMDDDGAISPIEESLTEDEAANPDCDIKLVEDSCFIISSEFPKKFSKKPKLKDTGQSEHGRTWKGNVHVNIKEGIGITNLHNKVLMFGMSVSRTLHTSWFLNCLKMSPEIWQETLNAMNDHLSLRREKNKGLLSIAGLSIFGKEIMSPCDLDDNGIKSFK